MGIRKNQSSLTLSEISAFVDAVKALKADGAYDVFVAQHRAVFLASPNDPAHGGPAFVPGHRGIPSPNRGRSPGDRHRVFFALWGLDS